MAKTVCLIIAICLIEVSFSVIVFADNTEVQVQVVTAECSDGVDNDGDLLIDYPADLGCTSLIDNSEESDNYECSDGIDNDSDGDIDYPNDLGCDSSSDNTEDSDDAGGGSRSGAYEDKSSLLFEGYAYPNSKIYVIKDGSITDIKNVGKSGKFTIRYSNHNLGTFLYSFKIEDTDKTESLIYSVPVSISSGTNVLYSNIVIPPTISIESKNGNFVSVYGSAGAGEIINIKVNPGGYEYSTRSGDDGKYYYTVDISNIPNSTYNITAYRSLSIGDSTVGRLIQFEKSGSGIQISSKKGDLDGDSSVDLTDFSIAAFWYKRELNIEMKQIETNILNGDGIIDLKDISIMAYHWSGS